MKNKCLAVAMSVFSIAAANAQIGVGTTTPNSTLDVRGSLSTGYRAFSASTSAATADNMLVFTGTSAATLTLPDATTCAGRTYWIKSTSSNASVLTVGTTASQTIDGAASWTLPQTNKAIALISNGANWVVTTESLPGNGTAWTPGGNGVLAAQNIGTTTNFDFPVITNNTEKMRVTSTGNIGIGTTSFNATNPEKLVVDAGTTASVNAIVGKGTINSYLQLNIQNLSAGTSASSDVVATADNGSETTNFVDMGINSSTNTSGVMGGANDAYLYNVGQNFLLGTGTAAKSLVFMTGGTTQSSNERMRISGTGLVGIGTNSPASLLEVGSSSGSSTAAIATRTATSVSSFTAANFANYNGGVIQSTYPGGSIGQVLNIVAAGANSGNWPSGIALWTRNSGGTNASEKMRITDAGNVGIGCTAPNYKLQVVGDIAADGGTLRAASAVISTTITACSDIRYKKNIAPLNNALDNVMKLQGVTYNWKVSEFPDKYFTEKKQIGIIAQELEKIYPELVETDAKGYKTVDYSKIAPILIESVKEQQQEIKGQQEQLKGQQAQIDMLKSQLEEIKKALAESKK